jgi:MFS family permease
VPTVLSSPRLRRILAAYSVNRLGTWIGTVALSLAVYDHTHSALAVAATLGAAQVIPGFVVPVLVARVEASSRRRELTALYLFEAVATAALALLVWHFWLPAILLIVALDGTAALAASALLRSETARAARAEAEAITDAEHGEGGAEQREAAAHASERRANAALNVAFSVTFMLGPAIGGGLVAAAGAPAALLIDAGCFLCCAALLVDLHPHVEEARSQSVRERLRAAWGHINEVPALRALLLTQALAFVFFESGAPIEVAYAKTSLHAGDGGYGVLVAAWGVGVVAGSILFARLPGSSLRLMVSSGTLSVGLAYVTFSVVHSLPAACAAAILGGVGNGIQWAPLVSAIQRLASRSMLGRVMAALESIGALCPAVGLALGGALVALSSPRVAFLVVGVGAACTTALFARIPMDRPAPAPAAAEQGPPDAPAAGAPAGPTSEVPDEVPGRQTAERH